MDGTVKRPPITSANAEKLATAIIGVTVGDKNAANNAEAAVREITADQMTVPFARYTMASEDVVKQMRDDFIALQERLEESEAVDADLHERLLTAERNIGALLEGVALIRQEREHLRAHARACLEHMHRLIILPPADPIEA